MTRKSLMLAMGIVLFLLGSAGAALYLLARYEPAFYVRGNIEPGDQRKILSGECIAEFFKVLNGIASGKEWEGRLKEEQVNSYFAEDFITNHSVEYPLPEGFSEPRVVLEADLIRLGFRYGSGWKSTVISIDMRVWLIAREPNAVALKFERIHAGALPISAQSLLDRVADFAHQKDIEATWYRHNGRPVLVLRFEADKSNPRFQLLQLELRPGMLRIQGKSLDGSARLSLPTINNWLTAVAKLVAAKSVQCPVCGSLNSLNVHSSPLTRLKVTWPGVRMPFNDTATKSSFFSLQSKVPLSHRVTVPRPLLTGPS